MEEEKKVTYSIKADAFPDFIAVFRFMTEKLDFSKPFKVVINYDPEQPRSTIEVFEIK